ncbi:unnamed protein product [Cyprideis torosa]|uniref:Uncharacterized protein n=1 Tax=Cyprideis torosa TaxID=163714 RepID=A0A7R8ZP76_9CRUS|nr:unnamed protein product [Cyprideis torosa]CAG0893302.1 unnamed protein product [Cyprideis torosa]
MFAYFTFHDFLRFCQAAFHRADPVQLQEVFEKYATVQKDGQKLIRTDDFVRKFLRLHTEEQYNVEAVKVIGGVADTSKDGYVSFPEFQAFEALLCAPDALYKVALQLFDSSGTGTVSYKEFVEVIQRTSLHQKIPFDFTSDFCNFYFGRDRKRLIPLPEFAQFLHDFHEEHAIQAFKRFDKGGTGFISALDFNEIMTSIKSHLLTPVVKNHLVAAAGLGSGGHLVSYPYFVAFISLLHNMELVKKVYLNCTNGDRQAEITREEFLRSSQMMSQITPLEVEILFHMVNLIRQSGRVKYDDLEYLTPEQYMKVVHMRIAEIQAVASPEERGVLIAVLESAYRFTLGAIAGAVGATAVYPIDLVKTRLQNQRSGSYIGELMYKNSWDCFRKVIRYEGFAGLYRGLVPQLIGVAPEKAIKLTVNDLVRDVMNDLYKDKGGMPLWAEALAGGCAGGSQVVFTNPLEIVKIRLQVAGEIASTAKVSAVTVVKELGFLGLYKGARACFLRDIPFSAIYFPVYAHCKTLLADEHGYNTPWTLLAAGALGGVPAASLTTPADVIKTRLQVAARKGHTTYSGVFDAGRKILAEEGFKAFWKGAPARVFRSSPQFGVTLLTYEILQRLFYVDFGGSRPSGSEEKLAFPESPEMTETKNRDHIGGYRFAVPIIKGIETKFGLYFPHFNHVVVNGSAGFSELSRGSSGS